MGMGLDLDGLHMGWVIGHDNIIQTNVKNM